MKNFFTIIAIFAISTFVFNTFASAKDKTATVFSSKGDVKIIYKGKNIGVSCAKGMVLEPGDWIRTGTNAKVAVSFDENNENIVTIQANSLVVVKLDGVYKIQLMAGELNTFLTGVEEENLFRVLAPTAVAESENSDWHLSTDGQETDMAVFENTAYVYGINRDMSVKDKKVPIEAGYKREVERFKDPGEKVEIEPSLIEWFKQEKDAAQDDLQQYIEDVTPSDRATATSKGYSVINGRRVDILDYIAESSSKTSLKD